MVPALVSAPGSPTLSCAVAVARRGCALLEPCAPLRSKLPAPRACRDSEWCHDRCDRAIPRPSSCARRGTSWYDCDRDPASPAAPVLSDLAAAPAAAAVARPRDAHASCRRLASALAPMPALSWAPPAPSAPGTSAVCTADVPPPRLSVRRRNPSTLPNELRDRDAGGVGVAVKPVAVCVPLSPAPGAAAAAGCCDAVEAIACVALALALA